MILAGGPGTSGVPLHYSYSPLLFPFTNEPLIAHLLNFLGDNTISEVALLINDTEARVNTIKERYSAPKDISLTFIFDQANRGTAGSLLSAKEFVGPSDFIVINANTFVLHLDLTEVLAFHESHRNGITILAREAREPNMALENIRVGDNGIVMEFHHLHRSRDRRRRLMPCGIYIMNPCIFSFIPEGGYFDLKEQLVPSLVEQGIAVRTFVCENGVHPVRSAEDYWWINRELVANNGLPNLSVNIHASQVCDSISIGKNTSISPHCFIVGPVSIGPDCTIEDHVHIIGPTTIGQGAYLEKGSFVRESVLWAGARLKSNARIEYGIVAENQILFENQRARYAVVADRTVYPLMLHRSHVFSTLDGAQDASPWSTGSGRSVHQRVKQLLYSASKGTMDVSVSIFGLLALFPVFTVIAAAIKLDSPGPIFFRQTRCGKGGREFSMYKFRTMVTDADHIKKSLLERNEVDGPMFKLENDPRVTKVGQFLRRTSLDELPQLFNVLKGDMSLVGPRPLAYDEMKFCPPWRDVRLSAKPGMTGAWQAYAHDRQKFSEWIRHDIEYVNNRSLWLDLKILFKTVAILFQKKSNGNS